jgi:hypothetical protein
MFWLYKAHNAYWICWINRLVVSATFERRQYDRSIERGRSRHWFFVDASSNGWGYQQPSCARDIIATAGELLMAFPLAWKDLSLLLVRIKVTTNRLELAYLHTS